MVLMMQKNLNGCVKDAVFSKCGKYRYVLWRIWDKEKPFALFIGLNPSVEGDEINNDSAVVDYINISKRWGGFGGICLLNLFAYRTPSPDMLLEAGDPTGKDNDYWIKKICKKAGIVIAAWNSPGDHLGRDKQVCGIIQKEKIPVMCFGLTKEGFPIGHRLNYPPLYGYSNYQIRNQFFAKTN